MLFAAELDARESAYVEKLPARIADENARVVADLNAGKLYLASSSMRRSRLSTSRVVHLFDTGPTGTWLTISRSLTPERVLGINRDEATQRGR